MKTIDSILPGNYSNTNEVSDRIMTMLLGMPNLAGSMAACFLDSILPGNYSNTIEVFDRIITMIPCMANLVTPTKFLIR